MGSSKKIWYMQIADGPLGEFGSARYRLLRAYQLMTKVRPAAKTRKGKVWLDVSGRLMIWVDYEWDGPSGPTLDDRSNMRASLVHDALYQLLATGGLGKGKGKEWRRNRKKADVLFRKLCREDGMPWWRAWYYYWGVRIGGRWAAKAGG